MRIITKIFKYSIYCLLLINLELYAQTPLKDLPKACTPTRMVPFDGKADGFGTIPNNKVGSICHCPPESEYCSKMPRGMADLCCGINPNISKPDETEKPTCDITHAIKSNELCCDKYGDLYEADVKICNAYQYSHIDSARPPLPADCTDPNSIIDTTDPNRVINPNGITVDCTPPKRSSPRPSDDGTRTLNSCLRLCFDNYEGAEIEISFHSVLETAPGTGHDNMNALLYCRSECFANARWSGSLGYFYLTDINQDGDIAAYTNSSPFSRDEAFNRRNRLVEIIHKHTGFPADATGSTQYPNDWFDTPLGTYSCSATEIIRFCAADQSENKRPCMLGN